MLFSVFFDVFPNHQSHGQFEARHSIRGDTFTVVLRYVSRISHSVSVGKCQPDGQAQLVVALACA